MKRSNLITGLIYLAVGMICICIVLIWHPLLDALLCGFGGAGIGVGIMMIGKYIYWTRPQHTQQYREKLENESIELHDERKEQLRNKAGRYTYIIGLITICAAIIVIHILGKLGILPETEWQWINIFLFAYLVIQYVLGIVIYRWLNTRY